MTCWALWRSSEQSSEHSTLWREQRRAEQSAFNWLKRWSGGALCTLSPVAEQTRDEGGETGPAEEEEEEGDLEARAIAEVVDETSGAGSGEVKVEPYTQEEQDHQIRWFVNDASLVQRSRINGARNGHLD
jgi:hypothetical protein